MEEISLNKIAELSDDEILDLILVHGWMTTAKGPFCQCLCSKLTHFMGEFHPKVVNRNIDGEQLEVPDHDTHCDSLCPCQVSHFYKVEFRKGNLPKFIPVSGKNHDPRKTPKISNIKS